MDNTWTMHRDINLLHNFGIIHYYNMHVLCYLYFFYFFWYFLLLCELDVSFSLVLILVIQKNNNETVIDDISFQGTMQHVNDDTIFSIFSILYCIIVETNTCAYCILLRHDSPSA
ncbi:unnamed protein product [Prunus armeniaca]